MVKNLNELQAERKRALTETPISNAPEDLFNILSFLGDEAGKDLEAFKDNVVWSIAKRPSVGQVRGFEKDFAPLHDIFRRVLLRRDKSMTIDGAPIVSPKKKILVVDLKCDCQSKEAESRKLEPHGRGTGPEERENRLRGAPKRRR